MNKTILKSESPKRCEQIARGECTILLSKTAPKLETPFKCYIYKTKKRRLRDIAHKGESLWCCDKIADKTEIISCPDLDGGKVIGEFIVERVDSFTTEFWDEDCYQDIRVRYLDEDYDYEYYDEFLITSNEEENPDDNWLCKKSCLTFEQIKQYVGVGYGKFYGLYISQLKIYDKPKELGEFKRWNKSFKNDRLTCPPRSPCYVEELHI